MEKHYLGIYLDQVPIAKDGYQRLVGKVIYSAHTRYDIVYVVSVVSQFMHSPSKDDVSVVMCILVYLKPIPGKGIFYRGHGHLKTKGFTDGDWASDV